MSEKQLHLPLNNTREGLESLAISPLKEIGAYEALWAQKEMSFKKIADKHRASPESLLSDFVEGTSYEDFAARTLDILAKSGIGVGEFGIRVHGQWEYPERLRDATHPVELLYFRGWWDLVYTRSVAVIGTRKPSKQGTARTRRLVKRLVADEFTVVSGLAAGIDTVAHTTAIELGGKTIGVIGTPISEVYPKQNARLQEQIANEYLLISQIPVWRYSQQGPRGNRLFFPQRNMTMSALTEATIIVEAGERSGTLVQADAALKQGRRLFILDNCFSNTNLTWPERFVKKGAVRVSEYEDMKRYLDYSKIH